jgi:hypothetical protein
MRASDRNISLVPDSFRIGDRCTVLQIDKERKNMILHIQLLCHCQAITLEIGLAVKYLTISRDAAQRAYTRCSPCLRRLDWDESHGRCMESHSLGRAFIYSVIVVLRMRIFFKGVSLGILREIRSGACGERAALMMRLLAKESFDKLHLSFVGPQIAYCIWRDCFKMALQKLSQCLRKLLVQCAL